MSTTPQKSDHWKDYELLNSGDGLKQERWGDLILIRPEAAATWPRTNLEMWKRWDGWFHTDSQQGSKGHWEWKSGVLAEPAAGDAEQGADGAQQRSVYRTVSTGATQLGASAVGLCKNSSKKLNPWIIRYRDLSFYIHPTTSKQVGLFPEQAINWDWCTQKIKASLAQGHPIKLLNLFGYTGAASIAAAQAGASVCHVDASKAMVSWCAQNATLSTKKLPIRFIVDDCLKFLQREQRRGQRYEAIILDPPTFGRGTHGEIWNIQEQLLTLLQHCKALLSERPLFLLMNTYSANLSPHLLQQICEEVFPKEKKSKLTRIFHTSHSEAMEKADGTRKAINSDQGCMSPYCSDQNSSLTQYPSALAKLQTERHEISGLTWVALNLKGSQDQEIIPCGMTIRWEASIRSLERISKE